MVKASNTYRVRSGKKHLRTSIGRSKNSRPKSKHGKRNYKKYRGQGK